MGRHIDTLISKDKALISQDVIRKELGDTIDRSTIRHDSKKLAERIKKIIEK